VLLRRSNSDPRLSTASWPDVGRAVAAIIPSLLPDTVAVLLRFGGATNQLVVAGLHRGFDGRIREAIALGQGVTGWVAANKQSMVNTDAELDLGDIARFASPPLRSCVSVPLVDGGEVDGVLTIYSPYAFSEMDHLFLESVAAQLSSMLSGSTARARSSNLERASTA
jgi:GAF domain-containing protein